LGSLIELLSRSTSLGIVIPIRHGSILMPAYKMYYMNNICSPWPSWVVHLFGHWIPCFLLRHDHLTLIKVVENLALIFNTLGQILWTLVEGPKLYGYKDVCEHCEQTNKRKLLAHEGLNSKDKLKKVQAWSGGGSIIGRQGRWWESKQVGIFDK
jgi:hypothetical protein